MRVVLQRVETATATHDGKEVARIGRGLVAFVGFSRTDDASVVDRMATKVARLRIFEDGDSKVGRSVIDIAGAVLTISQFTVYGDTSRGRRPGFSRAAPPDVAQQLYARFGNQLVAAAVDEVQAGPFRSRLMLDCRNWGPFTLMLDSDP